MYTLISLSHTRIQSPCQQPSPRSALFFLLSIFVSRKFLWIDEFGGGSISGAGSRLIQADIINYARLTTELEFNTFNTQLFIRVCLSRLLISASRLTLSTTVVLQVVRCSSVHVLVALARLIDSGDKFIIVEIRFSLIFRPTAQRQSGGSDINNRK